MNCLKFTTSYIIVAHKLSKYQARKFILNSKTFQQYYIKYEYSDEMAVNLNINLINMAYFHTDHKIFFYV